ncbi:MAG: hypothetical protein JXB13_00520, partial [Phycisphaerae bacterium]|nr:hypothetical protein [Phycisphaerae bacterium]
MHVNSKADSPARRLVAAAFFVLLAAPAYAQMACHVEVETRVARLEGLTELLPDLVLRCTGGTPAGSPLDAPRYQVLVTADAAYAGRNPELIPAEQTTWTEGLLLVEDPVEFDQRPCIPAAGEQSCELPENPALIPNVFQARLLQENIVAFDRIPVDPPGADEVRTLRIVNLRVNIAALALEDEPTDVGVSVLMFAPNGTQVPVEQFTQPVLVAQPGVTISVHTYLDEPVSAMEPALRIAPGQIPRIDQELEEELDPIRPQTFQVKFTEGFPGAFKRRSIGTSARDPGFLSNQSLPGARYSTESGFFNVFLGTVRDLDSAGVADSGTRLMAIFEDVPAGVDVYVSLRDVDPGTSSYSEDSPRALLSVTQFAGGGPYAAPEDGNFVRLSPIPNVGVAAVWEVVAADPSAIEEISFAVSLASPAQAPSLGEAKVYGFAAPVGLVFEDKLAGIPQEDDEPLLYLDQLRSFEEESVPRFAVLEEPLPLAAFEVTNIVSTPRFTVVSAASYDGPSVARAGIVSGFGAALANTTLSTSNALGTSLLGTSIEVIDSNGISQLAPLFMVSPQQVNFYLRSSMALGPAVANVIRAGAVIASGQFLVDRVAPSLFTANGTGQGAPAGQLLRVTIGFRYVEPLAHWDAGAGQYLPRGIEFGSEDELLILLLYGTGIRDNGGLSNVTATIDGVPVDVTYAGAQE